MLAGAELVEERLDLLVEEGPHRVGEVLVVEDLVALGVDRLALLVDDVVELDDALADVEVEALDAADVLAEQPRLAPRPDHLRQPFESWSAVRWSTDRTTRMACMSDG